MPQMANRSSATLICFQVSAGASVTIIAACPLAQTPAAQQPRRPSALSAQIVLKSLLADSATVQTYLSSTQLPLSVQRRRRPELSQRVSPVAHGSAASTPPSVVIVPEAPAPPAPSSSPPNPPTAPAAAPAPPPIPPPPVAPAPPPPATPPAPSAGVPDFPLATAA